MTKQQILNMLVSAKMYLKTQVHATSIIESIDLADAEDILDNLAHDFEICNDRLTSFKQANKYGDAWLKQRI